MPTVEDPEELVGVYRGSKSPKRKSARKSARKSGSPKRKSRSASPKKRKVTARKGIKGRGKSRSGSPKKRKSPKRKSGSPKKKRPLNAYFKQMLDAKSKGLASFEYKTKEGVLTRYVRSKTKTGRVTYKKSGSRMSIRSRSRK